MKNYCFLFFSIACFYSFSQITVNEINQESFDNFENSYNYTYWNNSWKTNGASRSFSNQTSSYGFNVDYTNLNFTSLLINSSALTSNEAFEASHNSIFSNNYTGAIGYSILQNGNIIHDKSNTPTSTGLKDSQLAEYGTWCNRRFVSTNFTNSPAVSDYYTGVEFTSWHNRFKMTFHVRPTLDIINGQLQFSVEIPAHYLNAYANGSIYGFADSNDQGFAVKAGSTANNVSVSGNIITLTTPSSLLTANTSYEISLLFYAIPNTLSTTYQTFFDQEQQVIISASQTSPNVSGNTVIGYNYDEGMHYLDIPKYGMGYNNCSQADVIQNIDIAVQNTTNQERRVRLCFRQIPNVNVVGFNSLLRNDNSDPSGYPLQVSKNWHNSTNQLFSGSWIKEYTELLVPANTTLNFIYTRTGAKWGETYSASSHQLSVVGAGVPRGGWLEAALGSFGENITHSPDYEYGNSNACDVRPFLVTNGNYGGTSSQCGWTGNTGGFDMWVYLDSTGSRKYQSQVKTKFDKYSPNLTETAISAFSSDGKLKLDYRFYLNRSDDFTRVYYKINVVALQQTSFSRFDIFQLGGDIYNIHNTQAVVYGNDTGTLGQLSPTNSGSNDYTTTATPLTGTNPWLWAGDGLYYNGASSGIDINTNNAMIIRDYKATFDGVANNTPYFRERSSSIGFSGSQLNNPTSYCLVPPPGVTSFAAGDTIELLVEVAILPKMTGDYYGPNTNFSAALSTYGNSHELLYRESFGNKIIANSSTNTIKTQFPLTIETSGNTALVHITGGKGYMPVIFEGLSSVTDPKLWKSENDCWILVDQSNHGKDFWQANYSQENGTYELVYNVNRDNLNDSTFSTAYYLGDVPPPFEYVDSISSCNPITWIDGNTYAGSNDTTTFMLTNIAGCDSLVQLNFNKLESTTGIDLISSCDPITWIDGNTYFSSDSSATFTLLNTEGCDSIVTLNFNMNGITANITENNLVLTANPNGSSYQWINCSDSSNILGMTNQDFTPTASGSYAVIISNGQCEDTSACFSVNISNLAESTSNSGIRIYPNPNNGAFHIDVDHENVELFIYDELGKLVHSEKLELATKHQVDLELATGIYQILVKIENGIFVSKLVVN